MNFHQNYTRFHFRNLCKTVINQWFLNSESREESEGCTKLRTQSCCCCKTGQTGLRRAKRHSEGKREQHWPTSSQSGCTGLMGGRGRSLHGHISIPQWLIGRHESGEEISPLFTAPTTKSLTPQLTQQLFSNVRILSESLFNTLFWFFVWMVFQFTQKRIRSSKVCQCVKKYPSYENTNHKQATCDFRVCLSNSCCTLFLLGAVVLSLLYGICCLYSTPHKHGLKSIIWIPIWTERGC